jgi:uncharacterized SAM-binding protein YcdF (DUF218 family)
VALVAVLALAAVAVVAAVPRDDALPDRVDAVVALGGSDARVALARDIAAEHDAGLVLSAGSIDFGQGQGLRCDVDAHCLRPDPDTTVGEARGMAELAAAHGWEHVAVATSSFHVNRSRLVFRQCLDDVAVVGTKGPNASLEASRRTLRELAGMAASLTVERAC